MEPVGKWKGSPRPSNARTEFGQIILFYVRALYDYTPVLQEEIELRKGDLIAVTLTPEDGWWHGEHVEKSRRRRGRNIFPRNFVTYSQLPSET